MYLSDHLFVKYDIFEATVKFPPRGAPILIITYYCEHHNMTYISQSNNNITFKISFPARQKINVWIIIVLRKVTNTVQQVM